MRSRGRPRNGRREVQPCQFLFPEHERSDVIFNGGTEEHPYIIGRSTVIWPSSPNRVIDWWSSSGAWRAADRAGTTFTTGHWHHVRIEDTGTRRPGFKYRLSMELSPWFRRKKGEDNAAGMMTLDITGTGRGWKDLRVWE